MLADARAATEPLVTRYLFSEAASAARRLELPDLDEIAVAHLQAALIEDLFLRLRVEGDQLGYHRHREH